MTLLSLLFLLLLAFQLKHYLADYPLQTPYMLGKFKDVDWVVPLSAHCAVHAAFTFLILAVLDIWTGFMIGPLNLAALCLFDFWMHFFMDRIKASPNLLGRFKPLNADQYRRETWVVNGGELSHDKVDYSKAALRGNTFFWWSLGLDQMVHHLTHYAIIFFILERLGVL